MYIFRALFQAEHCNQFCSRFHDAGVKERYLPVYIDGNAHWLCMNLEAYSPGLLLCSTKTICLLTCMGKEHLSKRWNRLRVPFPPCIPRAQHLHANSYRQICCCPRQQNYSNQRWDHLYLRTGVQSKANHENRTRMAVPHKAFTASRPLYC